MKLDLLKSTKFWYILLFSILWLGVAGVSLIHAVSFFNVANTMWLAIILAIIFEIGQAAVLFSILTSNTGKSKFMPWTLMCILTAVQIIGNVYSSYRYIMLNSIDNLKFFKEPIFIWTNLPDNEATVIITYIVGGILPLVSLAMSAMITNYLTSSKDLPKNNQVEIDNDTPKIKEIPTQDDIQLSKEKEKNKVKNTVNKKIEEKKIKENKNQESHFINL